MSATKITLHVDLEVQEHVTEDKSGYASKDDVPHLMTYLEDFARLSAQKFMKDTGKRVTIKRKWIQLEEEAPYA